VDSEQCSGECHGERALPFRCGFGIGVLGALRAQPAFEAVPVLGEELLVLTVDGARAVHGFGQRHEHQCRVAVSHPGSEVLGQLGEGRGRRAGLRGHRAVHRAFDHREEQSVLVLEVPRDGAPADARAFGDFGERGALEPALGEQLLRRVENAPATLADLVDSASSLVAHGRHSRLGAGRRTSPYATHLRSERLAKLREPGGQRDGQRHRVERLAHPLVQAVPCVPKSTSVQVNCDQL
jgi:hypothetical protein